MVCRRQPEKGGGRTKFNSSRRRRHRHDLAVPREKEKLLAIPPPARAVTTVARDAAPVSDELRRIASLKALYVDFGAAGIVGGKRQQFAAGRQGSIRAIEGCL